LALIVIGGRVRSSSDKTLAFLLGRQTLRFLESIQRFTELIDQFLLQQFLLTLLRLLVRRLQIAHILQQFTSLFGNIVNEMSQVVSDKNTQKHTKSINQSIDRSMGFWYWCLTVFLENPWSQLVYQSDEPYVRHH
jgi:hypothetical protein